MNPAIPDDAREEALRKVLRPDNPSFIANDRAFHHMLHDGVEVEYKRTDGSIAGDHVRLVDFTDAQTNDWLAVNPFTVIEGLSACGYAQAEQRNGRPDIVVFVNGLRRRGFCHSLSSVFVHNYRNHGAILSRVQGRAGSCFQPEKYYPIAHKEVQL